MNGNQDFGNTEVLIDSGIELLQKNIDNDDINKSDTVIIDCSNLESANSAMVAILLQWKSWLQLKNKHLALKNPTEQLTRLLSLYNLSEQFPMAQAS